MSLPVILQPGEGRSVTIRTSTCTFKATGKDTHGHFGLFEFVVTSSYANSCEYSVSFLTSLLGIPTSFGAQPLNRL